MNQSTKSLITGTGIFCLASIINIPAPKIILSTLALINFIVAVINVYYENKNEKN